MYLFQATHSQELGAAWSCTWYKPYLQEKQDKEGVDNIFLSMLHASLSNTQVTILGRGGGGKFLALSDAN